jgi:polysaccharide chain length determinant protein (PEP-CTERM system associated)
VQANLQTRIAEVEGALADSLLRNTERHPDVIALNEQLQQLRERQAGQLAGLNPGGRSDLASLAANPVYQSVQIALNDVNVQMAGLQGQIAERQRRVESLRNRLTTAPEIEAELARLNRDYGSTKVIYDQLTGQLQRERLVNQGDAQNVINFQIIDPPQASLEPIAPPRSLLLVGVLIASIALGGAIAFLLDQLNPVFIDTTRLRLATGSPILGAVNVVRSREGKQRHFREALAFSALIGLLVVFSGLTVVFKDTGSQYVQAIAKSITSA